MATKHNTETNDNPLSKEYFDDVLDLFYDNNDKTEELYNEVHKMFTDNQPSGFALGTSKSTADTVKTLSDLRATAIQGASALMNAKKTVAELELKKKAQSIEQEKVNNDSEYVRTIMNQIAREQTKGGSISRSMISSENRTSVTVAEEAKRLDEQKKVEENIKARMEEGSISFTKNEKAMKYDFNNEAEVVYDMNTETIKAVRKGTSVELPDYPVERGQVGEITRIEVDEGLAYSDNGKKIRITYVK